MSYLELFETLYYTGLRQGEAPAHNWNDFIDGYLNINKTISKETIDNEIIINSPKTADGIRKVKLDNELVNNLEILKNYYKNCIGFKEQWFIFGGLHILSPTTIGRKKDKF